MILCHGIVVERGLHGVNAATIPDFDQSMGLNVRSIMHLVSMATPFMKQEEKGTIAIISSNQGTKPDPRSPLSSMSHAMVQMLVKCVALETAYHGIRINAVAPGVTIS